MPFQSKITPVVGNVFQRPANVTAYAAGQVAADSTSAATLRQFSYQRSMAPYQGGVIRGGTLIKSTTNLTTADFRLWLFRNAIGIQNDGAAFAPTFAEYRDQHIGHIDFLIANAFAVGANLALYKGVIARNELRYNLSDGLAQNQAPLGTPLPAIIYGVLEARAAYTPGNAEFFKIQLDVEAD